MATKRNGDAKRAKLGKPGYKVVYVGDSEIRLVGPDIRVAYDQSHRAATNAKSQVVFVPSSGRRTITSPRWEALKVERLGKSVRRKA